MKTKLLFLITAIVLTSFSAGYAQNNSLLDDLLLMGSTQHIEQSNTTVFGKERSFSSQIMDAESNERWSSPFGGSFILGDVYGMYQHNDDVYIYGEIEFSSDGINAGATSKIVRWDGDRYNALPGIIDGEITVAKVVGGSLYIAGSFSTIMQDDEEIEADGIARLVDGQWESLGDIEINGEIITMTSIGNSLFIGGIFTSPSLSNDHIARFNTASGTWSDITGSNFNARIMSLTADENFLYAGGYFSNDDLNSIAVWDGTEWSAMDEGVDGEVIDVQLIDGTLYIGGLFTKDVGGSTIRNVAKIDLSETEGWQSLAVAQPNGLVNSVKIDGDDIYIGGLFSQVGIQEVNGIAKLTGGTWSGFGAGLSGDLNTIVVLDDNMVLASGDFANESFINVGLWNGSAWTAIGNPSPNALSHVDSYFVTYSTAVFQGDLYVGFIGSVEIDGKTLNSIARWDGQEWHDVDGGIEQPEGVNVGVLSLAEYDGHLYVAGSFEGLNSITQPVNSIARWNGTSWSRVGSGLTYSGSNALISAIDVIDEGIIVAGNFEEAGGIPAETIARWNGSDWFSYNIDGLESDLTEKVRQIGDHVFLVGQYQYEEAGETIYSPVVRLDPETSTFEYLGVLGSSNEFGADIIEYNGEIILGGMIEEIDGNEVGHLVVWNETDEEWQSYLGKFQHDEGAPRELISRLYIHDDILYVGGEFVAVDDVSVSNGIVKVVDGEMVNMGTGLDFAPGILNVVFNLTMYDDQIAVGGLIYGAGESAATGLAFWSLDINSNSIDFVNVDQPAQTQLHQNYPNPFNPTTTITYDIVTASEVTVSVYDMMGRQVTELVNSAQAPGTYSVNFDASSLASGIYLYSIRTQDAQGRQAVHSRRMTLIK
ncbi:MAG: T9SS type A sorting domain-containing protein [Balneolales bacterium]|nr:T9SS type A sorting domain-containing protein [Balneolales bacterium]